MAKAKEITGLDCNDRAVDWALEVLRVRFAEISELRPAALDFKDPEGVHAMRVATRRMRSAIRDFQPFLQKRAIRGLRQDLKMIAAALGRVRDEDVAIAALEKLQTGAPDSEIKNGIEAFLIERRSVRDDARFELSKAIAVNQLSQIQENWTHSVRPKTKKHHPVNLTFNQAGRVAVASSLAEFYKLGKSLYDPFAVEKIHRFRIAAKRVRYAVELFTACWGKRIAPFAAEIARMQAALGEVHDSDVWIGDLSQRLLDPDFIETPAAVWLLSKFVKKRTANYRQALRLWSDWRETDFAARMQQTISGEG